GAAELARSAVRALAGAGVGAAAAGAGRAGDRPARRDLLGGGGAVPDDGGDGARAAGAAGAVRVPGAERAPLRRARREAGSLVPEPGRGQRGGGVDGAPVLPPALPSRAHVHCPPGRGDPLFIAAPLASGALRGELRPARAP